MGGIRLDVAALRTALNPIRLPDRPGAFDFLPAPGHPVPDVLRNNAQLIVLDPMPLALGLHEAPLAPRHWVPACLGAIPRPPTYVLLVLEDAADRRRRPPAPGAPPSPNGIAIQFPDDRLDA